MVADSEFKGPSGGNEGWCTDGRWKPENVHFVKQFYYLTVRGPLCRIIHAGKKNTMAWVLGGDIRWRAVAIDVHILLSK